jgi:hypothetical protein
MPDAAIGLNAVIVAVTEEVPRILTVRRESPGGGPAEDALPFGPLEPETDRTLDRGLRRWVRHQASSWATSSSSTPSATGIATLARATAARGWCPWPTSPWCARRR